MAREGILLAHSVTCSQSHRSRSGIVVSSVPGRESSAMIAIDKRSPQTITRGYGSLPTPWARIENEDVDSEVFQRQCALLENNEQAARQRAHQNKYWRQRTLTRMAHLKDNAHIVRDLADLPTGIVALEAMDPKHRIAEMLNVFMDEYNKLKPDRLFLDWLDSMTPTAQAGLILKVMEENGQGGVFKPEWVRAFNRSVRYMHAAERRSYQIEIRNGLLFQNDAPFDTGKMKTEQSGIGVAIFVQSADGTFYSSNHVWGRLHRSRLESDAAIRSAGEWQVRKGKIAWISGQCAHYKPTMDQLLTAIEDLQQSEALKQSRARVFDIHDGAESDIDASFLVSRADDFRVFKNG